MDFDQHRTEIVHQTELLAAGVRGADLRAPVPSCPGWSIGALLRHIGGGQRWAEHIVRTRATEFQPDDQLRVLDGDDSGAPQVARLVEGAQRLADTLRAAGPDAVLWAPFQYDTVSFWARRFTHETLVHRADATLATGTEFVVAEDVALDAVDEWMELDAIPAHFDITPEKRRILGAGRTIALEATDADAAWFVDLTGEVNTWHRGHESAAATVRAPLTDLLLLIYGRKALGTEGIKAIGDENLLDLWLAHVAFA
jgi:uncharacterized protein (TIGR03083 family)